MLYLFISLLLLRLILYGLNSLKIKAFKINVFKRRIYKVNNLFSNNFVNSQILFATKFNELANVSLIKQIDASKAYALIMERYANEVLAVHQYNTFDYSENKSSFNVTIFVLKDTRVIELGYDYAEVLYTGKNYNWAEGFLNDLATCRIIIKTQVMGFARAEVAN